MKLILKLMPLILLMTTSLKSFSQNVTNTSSIQLQTPIAREVIKDLITGDGAKDELSLTIDKLSLLQQKITLKDSIIKNLNTKLNNYNVILDTKSNQLELSKELSKKLQTDLKKQKFKTKLMGGAGIVVAISAAFLIN